MTGAEVGILSVVLILVLIYLGLYVPVALGLVSFICVWIVRGDIEIPIKLLAIATGDTVAHYIFGVIPLFVLMGLLVSNAGLGRDIYDVANWMFRMVRGGLGIATVAANAVFAAITGTTIASASVFTRVSLPEMQRFGYESRFAVGVIAGSSVLGMLIPPSVMLILYAVITEQSIGDLFLAGVLPGIVLSVAYAVLIIGMAYITPGFVGRRAMSEQARTEAGQMTVWEAARKMIAPVGLIGLVMGGIYGAFDGWFWGAVSLKFTPTEAGAVGAFFALVIALAKRSLTWAGFWKILVETGHITASILFLIVAASMYSRMLGITGIPSELGAWLQGLDLGFVGVITLYVVLLLLMGTILDTVSIILIVVPLFLPVLIPAEGSLFPNDVVWFGIVTVIGAEIGLLTPPLGIACFVIKSTLDDKSITLFDIFAGAFPFAVTMLLVLILIIAVPWISLALI